MFWILVANGKVVVGMTPDTWYTEEENGADDGGYDADDDDA